MNPPLVDVAVLILFFNRPEPLAKVFEQVRKARPAKLFLYQDGPRGERDLPGIQACRALACAGCAGLLRRAVENGHLAACHGLERRPMRLGRYAGTEAGIDRDGDLGQRRLDDERI